MNWSRQSLISLRESLARLYPSPAEARRVAGDAGLDAARIATDPIPINSWYLILDYADKLPGKVDSILRVALGEFPDNEALQRAASGAPAPPLAAPDLTDWHGPDRQGLEKIIGSQSSLVPITYLQLGLDRSRAVAKVVRGDGASGTGFLTGGGLLVTNNHVLPDPRTAATATALFNYQDSSPGLAAEVDARQLLPDEWFRSSVEDDWSAVRVAGEPQCRWGELELTSAKVTAGDRVNIIQHPGGQQKRVSLYSSAVVFVGANRLQYLTDTEPGSSGAPVFDKEWNVVAVHHSGGWLPEPGAQDPTRRYYRNEGILIDTVIAGLGTLP
jgi:hypothetical protein